MIYLITVNNAIIYLLFPVPEPSLLYKSRIFEGYFGIPFQDSLHTTYTCTLHPSKILPLYNLCPLVLLYPLIFSSTIIRYLVLHTLPSCLSRDVGTVFLSKILPPLISSPITHEIIRSYFILQSFPVHDQ